MVLFYLLSAVMGGVGFWFQHKKEQLKNYGQVLIAGGFSGIYFTTYAAHVIEPIRVIPNANVTLLLLFAWGGSPKNLAPHAQNHASEPLLN